MRTGEKVHRLLDPPLTQLVQIGIQRDRQDRRLPACHIQHPQVRAKLIGDLAVAQGRIRHIESLVTRVLLQVRAIRGHRPHIHCPIAIAQKIHATVPPHRVFAGPVKVREQLRRLLVAAAIFPQVLDGSALVSLGGASVEGQACEDQRRVRRAGCRRIKRPIRNLRQSHDRPGPRLWVDQRQLLVRQRGELVRGRHDPPIGRPSDHHRSRPVKRQARRQSARERHDIHLCRPLILAGERHLRFIGRDRRAEFIRRMAGQPGCDATRESNLPQVALGHEHQRIFPQRGLAVVPDRRATRRARHGTHRRCGGWHLRERMACDQKSKGRQRRGEQFQHGRSVQRLDPATVPTADGSEAAASRFRNHGPCERRRVCCHKFSEFAHYAVVHTRPSKSVSVYKQMTYGDY